MNDFAVPPQQWEPDMWWEAIKAVVRFGALPNEDLDDVVAAGWLLGEKRAALQHRPFQPAVDPQIPLMIFCWWPFKTAYSIEEREQIVSMRGEIIRGLHRSRDIRRIEGVIPDEILTMTVSDLNAKIEKREVANELLWSRVPVEA